MFVSIEIGNLIVWNFFFGTKSTTKWKIKIETINGNLRNCYSPVVKAYLSKKISTKLNSCNLTKLKIFQNQV